MTTLRVKFPLGEWPGWHIPEFILNSVPTSDSDDDERDLPTKVVTVSIDPKTQADYYSDSPVFRASFFDALKRTNVVLKFAMREDLIADLVEEADVYTGVLEPLQGSTIPRYHGLYAGSGEDGQTIACLVLEYWGECLRRPFRHLPMDNKLQILQRLGEIHRRGLLHGDFAERNILERNGDFRIIDFDQSSYHDCDCDMDFRPGQRAPDVNEFGCEQLWRVCRYDMRIWAN